MTHRQKLPSHTAPVAPGEGICPTCGSCIRESSRESLRKSLPDVPSSESDEEREESNIAQRKLRKALPEEPASEEEGEEGLSESQRGFTLNRLDPSAVKKSMVDRYGHVELRGSRAENEESEDDEETPLPPPKVRKSVVWKKSEENTHL